jgi:hypothetical protein
MPMPIFINIVGTVVTIIIKRYYMLKKTVIFAFIAALVLAEGTLVAQKGTADRRAGDDALEQGMTRDNRIPDFMKRLVAGIKDLRVEPDKDGKYIFTIKSGYVYDQLERQHYMVYRKAYVYMTGDRVTKMVFEYYQFSMDSNVRDVKIFTNDSPENDELKSLQVDYSSNTGEKESYTVGDIGRRESRRSIISQYVNYLISLTYNIEMAKHRSLRIQSINIERTIQLGE